MTGQGLLPLLPSVIADSWWNPIDWVKQIGGFLHGTYDQATGIKDALGSVLSVFSVLFRMFTDTGGFLADAVQWLGRRLFPPDLQTWFLGTIGYPGTHGGWDPSSSFQNLYRVAQPPALLLAATSAAMRALHSAVDHRVGAGHALAETLPRFLLCVALIGVPGTGVSPGFTVIAFAVNASVALASGLFATFLHASFLQDVRPGQDWFGQLVQVIGNGGHALLVVLIGFIPLLVMFLYAAVLLVLRTIMIGFCVATAPLCLATMPFDTRNRFLQHWLDMFVGAALTPVVMGTAISVSFTLAAGVVGAPAVGPLLAIVTLCGGVWMSGKLVHQLTWRHFSHGGALAGFAAGVSTVLAPVQRLAPAAFMAEALGMNRGGGNRGIEAMKRMGLAAQGLHPGGSAGSESALGLSLRGITASAPPRRVSASGGPPHIAGSLGAAGRLAVRGAEDAFEQSAFDTFAAEHSRLVGALTRDHPYGSLPFADRAKLAWQRVSPRGQRGFADEFLSQWLGAPDGINASTDGDGEDVAVA